MANGLSITGDMNRARVFQCPSCKQTIDTSAQQCRFCSAPIDSAAAEVAANFMARLNQACSDASYLKIALVCAVVFLGVMFLPFVSLVGVFGYYFLTFAIPVWTVRWWIRFWNIKTDDPDFRRAKRTMILFGIPCSMILLAYFTNIVTGFIHPTAQ